MGVANFLPATAPLEGPAAADLGLPRRLVGPTLILLSRLVDKSGVFDTTLPLPLSIFFVLLAVVEDSLPLPLSIFRVFLEAAEDLSFYNEVLVSVSINALGMEVFHW